MKRIIALGASNSRNSINKKFEHNLFLGRSSVHTSQEALDKSLEKTNEIYSDLAKQNKL